MTRPNYASYYLPQLYSENYRVRSAEELDALPEQTIVVGVDPDGYPEAYRKVADGGDWPWASCEGGAVDERSSSSSLWVVAEQDSEWLFVVYHPDVVPTRRDGSA